MHASVTGRMALHAKGEKRKKNTESKRKGEREVSRRAAASLQ